MTTTRVLAGLVSNGNVLADGTITPAEIGVISISGVTYPGDDQAANPAGGQTITVNGAGFASTPTVYVGGVIAPSVSFISSSQITFTSPAKTAGTYDIYVVNPSGSTAIRVYGISYSGVPAWTTGAGELGPVDANFTIQLVATGDAPLTYALTSGSTLPSGVTLSSGGLITGSALTVEQTFNFSVDAIDAQLQETPRSFAVTVSLADPYFKYVTLLLAGDPPVTPFNSDASTNNFNVAINGDVRSDSFTPYRGNGYYGTYFNGSSDYASASQAAGALGTNDFTIEMWYRSNGGHGTYARAVSKGIVASATTGAWGLGVYRSGNEFYWSTYYSGVFNDITTGINLNDGVWHHIVATRVGTTVALYSDGVQRATGTIPAAMNFGSTTDPFMIAYQSRDNNYVNGNISNLRVIIGTALYTGTTYTVPTSPLTAVTNTVLLTCQSNRFLDNSTNAYAITNSGSPQITAAQPFTLPGGVATYGSGYFDGSGDYLATASSSAMAVGTGDYTLECWVYATSTPNDNGIYEGRDASSSNGITLTAFSGTSIRIFSGSALVTASNVNYVGCWCHVAVSRVSGTTSLYINGVSAGSSATSYDGTRQTAIIGAGVYTASAAPSSFFPGYISNFRLVKGTAVYTANFTPPTSPLTAITNTSLLIAQYNGGGNNSGFKDSSLNSTTITRTGNVSQGTFTPYGANWSNYLGSGNGFALGGQTAFAFGTGDYTVECWFYKLSSAGSIILDFRPSSTNGNYPIFYYNSSGGVSFDINGTVVSSGAVLPNTWNHVAYVRSSGVTKIYVNGTQSGSSLTDTVNYLVGSARPNVGINGYTPQDYFDGYISNLRIVKGTAVYTANFTPSSTPLTAISGTSLLTCQSNRFIDNSTNAFSLTVSGTPSVQRFSPFGPSAAYTSSAIGGSAYFDGASDRLDMPGSSNIVAAADFTLSLWVYPVYTVFSTYKEIMGNWSDGTSGQWLFEVSINTGKLQAYVNGTATSIVSSSVIPTYTWTYISLVRSGSTVTLYFNGVSQGSTTYTGVFGSSSRGIFLGDYTGLQYPFNAYISDVRFVAGSAITSLPTSPLTAVAGTQLLLNFTNAGVIDNAMMNDLETVGNAAVTTSIKKYGTGSVYLDGTNSILTTVKKVPLGQGTGDFTIEFWFRPATIKLQTILSMLTTTASVNPHIYMDASGFINYYTAGAARISGSIALTANTWYFVTLCRASGTTRLFINGTQSGSSYTDTNNYVSPAYVNLGQYMSSDGAFYTAEWGHGYFDDLRLSNYARYTANFTPPTVALKLK